ncbi:carboxypeptidase-like regulatory domain-containing protein [Flavobacterium sp.]|uniref:carboxypeptidase-like regulatory domain-containing protein n=1 Tax=Flavobacterium sp. TaxID=239 RepID=UPI00261633E1|nr:carboxypeptidase-like regulatory domain-containing protein [Flavobacterium sp.]
MKNKINISIPKPCQENWLEMTPSEQGRFCQLCNKNVFDFTQSSDREIAKAIEKDAFLCGRFTTSQLDRELIVPKEKSSIWLATTSAIISFLGLGSNEVLAQEEIKVEQTINTTKKLDSSDQIKINGRILDNEYSTLSGVKITSKKENRSTISDNEGKFSIEIDRNDTLTFNIDGFVPEKHSFNSERGNFEVILNKKTKKIQYRSGVILYVKEKKQTFFGRIFNTIGNWFR